MRSSNPFAVAGVALVASAAVVGALAAWTPARGQESAAKLATAAPIPVSLPSKPPKGAIVLFSGRPEELRDNWYRRYTTDPANWTAEKGVATPLASAKADITSRAEFGDCYLHAEFKTPVYPANQPNAGHGNSGVALQGRYEVQILGDHGKDPAKGGAGALYSQKPPIVNASKPAGEWQTMDIIFRAPRFDASGQIVEKPRATVFQNGVLVQNNEEFTGMTGIQYGQYKEMTKTGPIVLQGDHDLVQFRNVWVVPL